jgi:hypothetical protein
LMPRKASASRRFYSSRLSPPCARTHNCVNNEVGFSVGKFR